MRDLVVPVLDPGNPVEQMVATLVCDGTIADSTPLFPVSPDGFGSYVAVATADHHPHD